MADEAQVIPPAEVEEQVPEVPEVETPETEELTPEQIADLRKQAKKADDQEKRAQKAEAELKKLKGQRPESPTQPEQNADTQEEITRSRLEARGILDEDEQNEVMRIAKVLGVKPTQALTDPLTKARLEAMRADKAAKDATPAPSRSGGSSSTNVSRLADKALQTGELPTDPELRAKVKAEMKRRGK